MITASKSFASDTIRHNRACCMREQGRMASLPLAEQPLCTVVCPIANAARHRKKQRSSQVSQGQELPKASSHGSDNSTGSSDQGRTAIQSQRQAQRLAALSLYRVALACGLTSSQPSPRKERANRKRLSTDGRIDGPALQLKEHEQAAAVGVPQPAFTCERNRKTVPRNPPLTNGHMLYFVGQRVWSTHQCLTVQSAIDGFTNASVMQYQAHCAGTLPYSELFKHLVGPLLQIRLSCIHYDTSACCSRKRSFLKSRRRSSPCWSGSRSPSLLQSKSRQKPVQLKPEDRLRSRQAT